MDEKQSIFAGEAIQMTPQEMSNMTAALKDPHFRKLLAEYCNEIADPKNQALYERELTQYEAERGIALTFIKPEPGFVIKTIGDGHRKVFINVARNGNVDRPTSRYATNSTGRRGLQWSIPLTQAPPRSDYDNKRQPCTVYDVVFHPDTLHLAARNREFRQLVTSTACDAVESAFAVRLDRTNLRFPKMAFKGTVRPTVIRNKVHSAATHPPKELDSANASLDEQFYPSVDKSNLNGDRAPTVIQNAGQLTTAAKYAVPKYKLVHRRTVDMHEMTGERDAKLNATLPKELEVTVDLPLLKSSQTVKLDVRERTLELVCEEPAKYQLTLPLPYAVVEDSSRAQFDSGKRQLTVTMPVDRAAELQLQDLTRVLLTKQTSDSGVDSPSSHSHSSDEELPATPEAEEEEDGGDSSFLDRDTAYQLPTFTTNALDNDLVFTLNVKNVDPASVEVRRLPTGEADGVHVKFLSVGAGFVPSHYAFRVQFAGAASVERYSAEAWDNNVVLQLELNALPGQFCYGTGRGPVQRGHLWLANKTESEAEEGRSAQSFGVVVRESAKREVTIELLTAEKEAEEAEELDGDVFHDNEVPAEDEGEAEAEQELQKTVVHKTSAKAGKREKQLQKQQQQKEGSKKKRKARSLSESDLKHHQEGEAAGQERRTEKVQLQPAGANVKPEETANGTPTASGRKVPANVRKARSMSESSGGGDIVDADGNLFHFKGILKRRSLTRSVSDSGSSVDDGAPAVGSSCDLGVGSFGGIPEEDDDQEGDEDSDHLIVGSEKKHVTFNEVIRRQEFRADSSIVGRKLKNKKRAKKRAENRRLSESENSEAEDKHHSDTTDGNGATEDDEEEEEEEEKAEVVNGRRRDSGVDFSDDASNGTMSHEEDGGVHGRNKKKKHAGKSGCGGARDKEAERRRAGKEAMEFKSGMIFNLEM